MPHPRYTSKEIVRRGEELYEREIRARVDPEHTGKFLVVDIETGEYEIDADELAALDRAKARNPEGARYLKRIGYRAAHRLGGALVGMSLLYGSRLQMDVVDGGAVAIEEIE